VVHNVTSFPYTANQTGSNYSDTITIQGTNLSATGSALNVTGHDIVVYLVNDTITFGTDDGDNRYGIQLSSSSYNIKIIGGMIYHDGSLGNHNNCMYMAGVNDLYIENTDMRIVGDNGHCIFTPSISSPGNYNVEISGGHYRSDVTKYTSRCNYDGCALVLENTFADIGDYHFKIHGMRLVTGPSQGMYLAGRSGHTCFTEVYSCTLSADARNLMYTSGNVTCHSAANPYLISGTRLAPGSSIHDNVLQSGTSYGGSRGIIIEMAGMP